MRAAASGSRRRDLRRPAFRAMTRPMLTIDLTGKHALVAGVADDGGFGFAIAKALAEAGATVAVATWPPALGIFKTMLERGKMDASLQLRDGKKLAFSKIYPLDAEFDQLDDVPAELRESRRYRDQGDFTIGGLASAVAADGGVDIVVHSLANGPEVKKPLLETSRRGYLGALSASAYSMVSMVHHFGPIMRRPGAFLSLSYMASERVVPGYGGGMSSAKAALESDTRVLAYEAGRAWGHRINVMSPGPYASRAASAIGFIQQMIDYTRRNAPLPEPITADEVGATAAFLCSPLATGITGATVYVDKGFHAMGLAVDREGALPA
jgi:enoyl-[acyl-carrier protein] reductase I